ncbi:polyprenyl synthetase family protein [Corynebacterium pygosceleis]|uniref:Polyprenyl synthetase family protein n=1 Tax=Corynebacterium pygosceleis TaxID=2800406 RepID=A0A9Q4GIF5_9CORY|nr:polyprenyl synthetase family protein [Corynebacterium pygosceleis]MCK7637470.1 polyprenyl synthetase family protein [Corynebacterium pygosceleis]MCK7674657.1 polyprenyl synthetase family protein [Corynebacterium pygosceleis]MCX7445001.1 polyprenyl synthetase family protein [Corynebacterium pygosceleis]MCX7468201.1 polyprenyl synthetase family protein [Corynebacterium pygosceleis]
MSNGRTVSHGPGDHDKRFSPGTSFNLGDEQLNEAISSGMREVEELLAAELAVGEEFVTDKVRYLAAAGGKRFRPMFALLASRYGARAGSGEVVKAAAVVEMTHLATLYHDDVMDEADKRRGVDSANSRWGNSMAILAGDYLLARASRIMAQLGADTVAHFAETFGELVTGQMRETVGPRDGDPIEHYRDVVREKTGVLIASAGYLGGLHGGAEPEQVDALRRFGYAIGTVFQIVDDIIDIYSDTDQSGKTPGTDLKEGVFTLPVLYALEEEGAVGDELRARLTGPVAGDDEVAEVLELLHRSCGREKALADVRHYVDLAEAELEKLPQNDTTAALRHLTRFTVSRVG